jgi:hypothetical protein
MKSFSLFEGLYSKKVGNAHVVSNSPLGIKTNLETQISKQAREKVAILESYFCYQLAPVVSKIIKFSS